MIYSLNRGHLGYKELVVQPTIEVLCKLWSVSFLVVLRRSLKFRVKLFYPLNPSNNPTTIVTNLGT